MDHFHHRRDIFIGPGGFFSQHPETLSHHRDSSPLQFIDQVVELGIFGDDRTDVIAYMLQREIGEMVKPGIVVLNREREVVDA